MQKMSKGRIEFYKEHYPRGTRVQLDSMSEDPCPVESGAIGTVIAVDDMGTLHVEFDNGRSLGLCPEVDRFHKIFDQTETQGMSM